MIGPGAGAVAHLDDAQLLRLMDGEGSASEGAAGHAHIAACDSCAGAMARLRDDAAVVAGWLDRAAFDDAASAQRHAVAGPAAAGPRPAATPRPGLRAAWRAASPALRAAAVIVMVAAPVAAIPALRSAVAGLVGAAGQRAAPAPAQVPAPAVEPAAAVRFEPAPGRFTVTLDAAQQGGTLRLVRATGPEVVLRAADGGTTGIVVAANSLHLQNRASSRAGYVLELPAAVGRVTVVVAGRVAAVLEADALPGGVELPIR